MKDSADFVPPSNPREATARDRSAGVPPGVAGASRPRYGEVTIRDRGRLPHWEKDGATYFVTFRLADSLPQPVLAQIEFERQDVIRTAEQLGRNLTPDERRKLQRFSTATIERYLDDGAGACHLRNPVIAEQMAKAIRHFDEKRYRLFAWCVMPNHVHIVCRLFPGQKLAAVVHTWKSYTAKFANKILGTHGTFWQREYYDHLLRSEAEFERASCYVIENPAKAGLRNWRWVWCGRDARTTAAEDGGATKT